MKPKLYCVCANLHTSLTTTHGGFLGPRNDNERNDVRTKTTVKNPTRPDANQLAVQPRS